MPHRPQDATPTYIRFLPPQSAIVGTTSAQVLPQNPRRTHLSVQSDPGNTADIWLAWEAPAEVGKGKVLQPGAAMIWDAGGISIQPLNAVSNAAGQKLLIEEGE